MNRSRTLSHLSLSAVLALGIAAPLSGGAPGAGRPDAQAQTQAQTPGQNRQGPRQNRTPADSWEWWRDAAVLKELGLSAEKAKQIDGFYNNRQRSLKPFVDEYIRERDLLSKMTAERVVDSADYALQVKKVEMLRSELYQSRAVMLYRIYRVLDPGQYQKLRDIFDRRSRRGRGGQ